MEFWQEPINVSSTRILRDAIFSEIFSKQTANMAVKLLEIIGAIGPSLYLFLSLIWTVAFLIED